MKQNLINSNLPYYQTGNSPQLLIHAGTHGDEYQVIDLVTAYLQTHHQQLPEFIYVPQVSPSAVKLKTRQNVNGHDINRIFKSPTTEEEVLQNQQLLVDHHFQLFITFHEDPEESRFYCYDIGSVPTSKPVLQSLFSQLDHSGIQLLTGYDDESDPDLGFWFTNGYRFFKHERQKNDSGMISDWLMNHQKVEHTLIPEIPGKLPLSQKQTIVELLFKTFFSYYYLHVGALW